jgi:hypothetical protein
VGQKNYFQVSLTVQQIIVITAGREGTGTGTLKTGVASLFVFGNEVLYTFYKFGATR